ncbi:MAG: RHS repeat-associated core domain-containing protein [Alphaproteobacteria bacterium]|nr:MAG: RHS repeat-associated core domain-containing protein [Alphaproteobacteria bacterium]
MDECVTSVVVPGVTTSIAWNEAERVTGISAPSFTGSYAYNAEGSRFSSSENGSSQQYLRDGTNVTAPVLEDSAATYTPGISERRLGVSTYNHSDLFNVGAQSASSGALTASQRYDAFGTKSATTGSFKGPYGYGGLWGYRTDASGLLLLGHRMYDSESGRFLSRDPAEQGRNWYAYCSNNPLNRVDPTGLVDLGGFLGGAIKQLPQPLPPEKKPEDPGSPSVKIDPFIIRPGEISIGGGFQNGGLTGSGEVELWPEFGSGHGSIDYGDGKGNHVGGSVKFGPGTGTEWDFSGGVKVGPWTGSVGGGFGKPWTGSVSYDDGRTRGTIQFEPGVIVISGGGRFRF